MTKNEILKSIEELSNNHSLSVKTEKDIFTVIKSNRGKWCMSSCFGSAKYTTQELVESLNGRTDKVLSIS